MITRCSVLHLKIEDQQIQIFQRKKDQQIHVSLHLLCSSFRMMFISWVQELDFSVSDANTTNTCRIGLKSRPAPASSCWATRAAPRPPPQPFASSSPCPRRRQSCRRKSGEQRGGRWRGHQLPPHSFPSSPNLFLPSPPLSFLQRRGHGRQHAPRRSWADLRGGRPDLRVWMPDLCFPGSCSVGARLLCSACQWACRGFAAGRLLGVAGCGCCGRG